MHRLKVAVEVQGSRRERSGVHVYLVLFVLSGARHYTLCLGKKTPSHPDRLGRERHIIGEDLIIRQIKFIAWGRHTFERFFGSSKVVFLQK